MTARPPLQVSLQGRTALVTGSGRNIGRALALAFADAGANVVVNGHRDRVAVERVAAEVRERGVQALALMADVSDHAQVANLVALAAPSQLCVVCY